MLKFIKALMYRIKESPFTKMVTLGDRLIESQRLEESLGKVYAKRRTPADLEAWKEARRWVEALAADYSIAVREWRENVEIKLLQEVSRSRRRMSLCRPLGLLRRAG